MVEKSHISQRLHRLYLCDLAQARNSSHGLRIAPVISPMRIALWSIPVALCFAINVEASPITLQTQLGDETVLIDFESFTNGQALPNGFTIENAMFSSLTGNLSILDVTHWGVDATLVSHNALFPGGEPDSAIVIDFLDPVAQFFLGWGDPSFSGNYLRAFDASGLLLEESSIPFSSAGTIAVGAGFSRNTADIARVLVQPVQPLPSGDDYVIDNIRYNTAPAHKVPEPSSTMLLALGAGLGAALRYVPRCRG
jgi:hypothetical protein